MNGGCLFRGFKPVCSALGKPNVWGVAPGKRSVPSQEGGCRLGVERRRFTVTLARAWIGVAVGLAGVCAGAGGPRYLAVFVDSRLLPITGAKVLDEKRIRLDLPDGAKLIVPLARLDRVIETAEDADQSPLPKPSCSPDFAAQTLPAGIPFSKEIERASRAANLHPWLVAAVIEAESGFDPQAVSQVGARGLMQLMPAVWVEQGILNPHDVRGNLRAGCRHLRALLDRFQSLDVALAAFNSGAATVERYSGVPPYRETRNYVRKVVAKFCPGSSGGPG